MTIAILDFFTDFAPPLWHGWLSARSGAWQCTAGYSPSKKDGKKYRESGVQQIKKSVINIEFPERNYLPWIMIASGFRKVVKVH